MGNRKSSLKTEKVAGGACEQTRSDSGVLLLVHMWGGGSASGLPPPLAVAMVEDLLSVSHCELNGNMVSPVEAVFSNIAQAVNAARRITRLIRSFCTASEEGILDGCLTLSMATESVPALDLPLLQQTRIVEPSRPGQVLVVGAICEEAKGVPGLRFTELSGGIVKAQGAGMRNLALKLLPPFGMEEVEGAAVVFKLAPAESKAVEITSEQAGIASVEPAHKVDRPAPFATVKSLQSLLITSFSQLAAVKVFLRVRLSNVTRRAAVAAIGMVVVLTVTAVYVGRHRSEEGPLRTPKARDATATQAKPSNPGSGTAKSTGTGMDTGVSAASDSSNVVAQSLSTRPKKADPSPIRIQSKTETRASVASTEKPVGRGDINFTDRDINKLIEKADKEAGDGNFDAAISNYGIVLKHDPTNGRAKQGIARARRNKGSE